MISAWKFPHLTPPLCQNGTKSGTCSGQLFQDRSGPRHFWGVCILGLGLGLVLVLVLGVGLGLVFSVHLGLGLGVGLGLGFGLGLAPNLIPKMMLLTLCSCEFVALNEY